MVNKLSGDLTLDRRMLNEELAIGVNFDIVSSGLKIGEKQACFYFVDGLCKDEVMQKILEHLMKKEEGIPYIEVQKESSIKNICTSILSGMFAFVVDGDEEAIIVDARTYPARSVAEPEKDKVLRGSKDGFVETIVHNTALIRRRIRDNDLRMEILNVGRSSKTDVVVCYMDSRVDRNLLNSDSF